MTSGPRAAKSAVAPVDTETAAEGNEVRFRRWSTETSRTHRYDEESTDDRLRSQRWNSGLSQTCTDTECDNEADYDSHHLLLKAPN
jgi:hypothetical protein